MSPTTHDNDQETMSRSRSRRSRKEAFVRKLLTVGIGLTVFIAGSFVTFIILSKWNNQHEVLKPPIEENIYQPPAESVDQDIEIAFVGDVMMDGSIKEAIKQNGVDYPFIHVKDDIKNSDYAVLNLETAVTTIEEKFEKEYNFKSDPTSLKGLTNAGFDMVSLGNNHAMDYGEEGLEHTIDYLNEYGLAFIGAGENDEDAYSARTVEINSKTIKFLGFSRVLPNVSWYAGKSKPGIASGYQEDRTVEVIKRERKECDYLFVYIHWGKERTDYPEDYQVDYAHKMIDAGADGIIGSHPHVLQGFEYYKGKPIAYSLGNFLFPNYVVGRTAETGILKITIMDEKVTLAFKPYRIVNNQVASVSQEEEERILDSLVVLSKNVKRDGYHFTEE